ncbi:zinc finger, CCHC-type containing protein [Tanacetum coccineum]|uniref:Zinc finger, CCHC-type containing protein n=1 Tax=Tanacetum coccineum TaxID=301880 RepID=A0ABQ5ATW8_9ASTR
MEWLHNLRIMLSVEDKLPFLEQPIPSMPVSPVGQISKSSAYDMLKEPKTLYAQQADQELFQTDVRGRVVSWSSVGTCGFLVPAAGQVLPSDVLNTHTAWVKASKEIVGLMLMTIDPDIQKNLEHLGAYDLLKELKMLYAQQADQELLQTVREFHAYKHEEGQSVSSCVLKMKSYIDNLERLGHAMTQNLSVSLILVSLRKEFDGFVQNYNMHNMGKTVTELHAMQKLHEQTLPLKEVAPTLHAIRAGRIQKTKRRNRIRLLRGIKGRQRKDGLCTLDFDYDFVGLFGVWLSHLFPFVGLLFLAHTTTPPFAPKPKNPPTPKKDNPVKDAICHQCGEVGHWRRNCPVYLIELMKKKKLSQGASTLGSQGK